MTEGRVIRADQVRRYMRMVMIPGVITVTVMAVRPSSADNTEIVIKTDNEGAGFFDIPNDTEITVL